jgi:hypothetical protein
LWVAVHTDGPHEVLGVIHADRSDDPDATDASGVITTFYVATDRQGQRLGERDPLEANVVVAKHPAHAPGGIVDLLRGDVRQLMPHRQFIQVRPDAIHVGDRRLLDPVVVGDPHPLRRTADHVLQLDVIQVGLGLDGRGVALLVKTELDLPDELLSGRRIDRANEGRGRVHDDRRRANRFAGIRDSRDRNVWLAPHFRNDNSAQVFDAPIAVTRQLEAQTLI